MNCARIAASTKRVSLEFSSSNRLSIPSARSTFSIPGSVNATVRDFKSAVKSSSACISGAIRANVR